MLEMVLSNQAAAGEVSRTLGNAALKPRVNRIPEFTICRVVKMNYIAELITYFRRIFGFGEVH
jgi:hypothetical protein